MAQWWKLLHNFQQSIVFTTDGGLLTFSHCICIINNTSYSHDGDVWQDLLAILTTTNQMARNK